MTKILECITDGVVIYDREWRIAFVNHRGAQIVGQRPEDLMGKKWLDVYPEVVGSTFYREFHRAIAQQVSVHFQEFYAPFSMWFDVHAYPFPEGLIVLYQDITQRKHTEEALKIAYGDLEYRLLERTLKLSQVDTLLNMQTVARQRAEEAVRTTNEQLATIVESITDGFCAVDSGWRYTYVNRKAEQILHKNQTELLGKVIWEVFPHAIGSRFYEQCHEALRTGVPVRFEEFCSSLERWFETSVYPSQDGLSIYFQDISDRKQVEAERNQLNRAEQEARAKAELAERRCTFLAQTSEVLTSSLDYQSTLKSVARLTVPFLADYCLIHRLEADGQLRMVAAVHEDSQKQALVDELARLYQTHIDNPNSFCTRVMQTGEPMLLVEAPSIMAQSVTQDPRLQEIHAQLNPKSLIVLPLTARKQMLGTLVLAMAESNRLYSQSDVATLLELARRAATAIDNAQLYHQAQESNRLKDEFLLSLSHELRTPLNTILGWANMLLTRNLNERMIRHAIETIERKAKAQVQIIYDLLDMSRLLTGRLCLNPGWVELGAIANEAIDSLQLAIEAKSIQLQSHCDRSVGVIRGDSKYLRQIVWHLLSNAIKFTPNGGQVKISLTRVDEYAQIQVSDTGVGIHPDFLPHVFERFRQADGTTTRCYAGLGLGLALVRQLVELHGGTVEAKSDGEGKGASFIVKLPIAPVGDSSSLPQEAAVGERHSCDMSLVLEGLRLLVVDDEPDSTEAITLTLTQYGAQVSAVDSVKEALEALQGFKPDLVIRNTNMVESDAYWLLSRMRSLCVEEGGQIPVIALTADAGEEEVAQTRSAGIEMYVPKPIAAADLAAIVATLARGS